MQIVSRLLMLCVLVVAPWCLAGAPLVFQPWLFGGMLVAVAAGILSDFGSASFRTFHWTALAFPLLGTTFLAFGGIQLLPIWKPPALLHSVLASSLHVFNGGPGSHSPLSLYPAETRLVMARIALAIPAFLGGAWMFCSRKSRNWLWLVLAANGGALVVFGLVQKATWNERIFWTIPLRFGGQPFSSFVNRNNAAGYFAMCLAAALGLMLRDRHQPLLKPNRLSRSNMSLDDAYESFGVFSSRLFVFVMIILLCTGILATLSRGGILSALAAFLVTLVWLGGFRRWRFLVVPLGATLILATVLIAWIGFGGQLHYRLASLQRPLSEDGRAVHWADMIDAVRDFPVFGTGLGTYRYANKPYQDHFSYGWYVNADNQYFEWLIEAGFPGLLIALTGLVILACFCRNLHRKGNSTEAVVCGFLLITQGLQSFTDFGITVTANLLTLAVLLGSLSATDIRDSAPLSTMERVQRALDQGRNRLFSMGIALMLILVAGLGWAEVVTAAAASAFRNRMPLALDQREQMLLSTTNAALQEGNGLLNLRPDDAELHATMARLWFYRYRLEAFEAMNEKTTEPRELELNWKRTDLDVLFTEVSRLSSIGATDTLEDFGRDPIAAMNLGQTWQHLILARRACPILPRVGLMHAAVGFLESDEDGREALRQEAALSPSDPAMLKSIGLYADRLGDRELFMACLQRQLQLNPQQIDDLLALATRRFETPEIVSRVLPRNPEVLIRIAEKWRNAEGRSAAMAKAELALKGSHLSYGQTSFLEARLAILDDKPELARKLFVQAIRENPLEVAWRIRYAGFLEDQGELAAALEQARLCQAFDPGNASIAERIRKLQRLLSNGPAPDLKASPSTKGRE